MNDPYFAKKINGCWQVCELFVNGKFKFWVICTCMTPRIAKTIAKALNRTGYEVLPGKTSRLKKPYTDRTLPKTKVENVFFGMKIE